MNQNYFFMNRVFSLPALLLSIPLVATVTDCVKTSSIKSEKVDGTEWNVSVKKAVQFCDSFTGVSTEANYTIADTAAINQKLLGIKPENLTLEWTIPNADGTIWLVAYENGPIISETVSVTEMNSIPSYGGNIQVVFKFPDAEKWKEITRDNIGKRLAIFVNGQLMNAPQVNTEITSGNCSVTIPANMIHEYLHNRDLETLKQ